MISFCRDLAVLAAAHHILRKLEMVSVIPPPEKKRIKKKKTKPATRFLKGCFQPCNMHGYTNILWVCPLANASGVESCGVGLVYYAVCAPLDGCDYGHLLCSLYIENL